MPTDIIVTGRANVSQKPDCINLHIRLKAQGVDYGTTLEKLNAGVEHTLSSIQAVGVNEEPETASYSIEEDWADPYDERKKKFLGYVSEQMLTVRLPLDMQMLGKVLEFLSDQEIKPSVHTYFEVRDPLKMQAEARQKAIEAAALAANDIAAQLGLSLSCVKSVKYDMPFGGSGSSLNIDMDNSLVMCAPEGQASFSPQINPTAVKSSDDIVITWNCK
ncbi:MAG: SIMPL domain-containing protein [Sulfuritalea sp.]|nr:SIMPL domain-containing protein [Sulfuritalea sp.]